MKIHHSTKRFGVTYNKERYTVIQEDEGKFPFLWTVQHHTKEGTTNLVEGEPKREICFALMDQIYHWDSPENLQKAYNEDRL
jgi:hypothetical protein